MHKERARQERRTLGNLKAANTPQDNLARVPPPNHSPDDVTVLKIILPDFPVIRGVLRVILLLPFCLDNEETRPHSPYLIILEVCLTSQEFKPVELVESVWCALSVI